MESRLDLLQQDLLSKIQKQFQGYKSAFQVYFRYFNSISTDRDTLTQEPISPDGRLAIYLSLGRGDYIHTVAELFGMGDSTACNTLRKKCSYLELFWSVFSRIWTEYGEIQSIQSDEGKYRPE